LNVVERALEDERRLDSEESVDAGGGVEGFNVVKNHGLSGSVRGGKGTEAFGFYMAQI
jgi:hypothetical protein